MNEDQLKSGSRQAVGKTKERAGKAIDDQSTERQGTGEKVSGRAQRAYGDVKKHVEEQKR